MDDLLSHITAAGLSLALELRVTPASGLTPELRQIIREHKAELLYYLSHVAPDGSNVRVSSIKPEEPGMAGCVVWEVEVTPEQPILPLDKKKRAAEKPVKPRPTLVEGYDTGELEHHERR